jgi:hypothetical protein
MKKFFSLTLLALVISYASFALGPLTPSSGTACIGSPFYITDSLYPGGAWSSSAPSIATIGSTGIMTGVSAGVVTITYTLGASYVTGTYTINPTPTPIVGGGVTVCPGATVTLTDATPGGVWNSAVPAIATVGSATGIVTGVSSGTVSIGYSIGGCHAYTSITVPSAGTVMPISGAAAVCVGSTITLTDATAGGTWSATPSSVATISTSGVLTGVAVGTVSISYTVSTSCGVTTVTRMDSVTTTSTPLPISGTTTVGIGAYTHLSDPTSGGTWSSSSTAIATVSGSGYVTGVSAGTCTITYTVTGPCGTGYVTTTVTVSPLDQITGNINFSSGTPDSTDVLKIWLIQLSGTTLSAVDSITTAPWSTSVPYTFNSPAADSYRVKAAVYHTPFSSTGYQPTYHLSSYYWSTASVFWHTAFTVDASKDINMMYGTVTAGPGFIAGNVTTGANKGTSGGAPAVGLLVYAINSAGAPVQHAYTDASGNYSFSNLPLGTYTIFPEALKYMTTAYTSITLTAASPSMTAASFTQHTVSLTITPHTASTPNVMPSASSVIAFPNPTNGNLYIQWTEKTAETATVTIADMTGRTLMSNTIDMNQGTGTKQLDLTGLANGTYLISVKSASLDYTNKVQIAH